MQVSQVALSKESGGRKEAARQISSRAGKTVHTHPLRADKKTKCQGWFWETAAGAAGAVDVATAAELGCQQRTNAFKFT